MQNQKNTDIENNMRVYCMNHHNAKYTIIDSKTPNAQYGINFKVSTQYQHYAFKILVKNWVDTEPTAMIAFYGIYGSGNCPVVKNVQLEYGNKIHSYEEKESKTITVTKDTQFPIYVDGYGEGTTITNNANAKMNITY